MTALLLVLAAAPVAPVVPLDPEDLDATRPEDLDTCGVCMGDGAYSVPTGDPAYPWDDVECWACAGSGQRGAA